MRTSARRVLLVSIVLLCAGIVCICPPSAPAAPPRGASLQALFAARGEDAKAVIFIKMRNSLAPVDTLTIVQRETSPWIAGMAVGVYLKSAKVDPKQAAVILNTFSQRPGSLALAATLGAASGQVAPIAEQILQLPRDRSSRPKLLAALMLATYVRMAADGALSRTSQSAAAEPPDVEPPDGEPIDSDFVVPGAGAAPDDAKKGAGKKGPKKAAGKKGGNSGRVPLVGRTKLEPLLAKLLTEKDAEILEATVLAAAWMRAASVKDAILALDATREPGVQGTRLLYMAKLKLDVPETLIEEVFSSRPRPAPEFSRLSPGLSYYDVRTSALGYGCEALGELGEEKYLDKLHDALLDRDLRIQIEAAKALEKIGAAESLEPLLEKVRSYRTPWPVLVSVLSAVGAIPSERSIPVLIERLEKETGRFRLDVNYALASITGDQVAGTLDDWKAWWEQNKAVFTVDPQATAAFRKQFRVQDMRVPSLGSFYDMEIYSDRCVFVLDTSASMKGDKIVSLKENLIKTFTTLSEIVRFNVIDFGGPIALMKPGGLITAGEIPLVVRKVAAMKLTLGTRSYDAMELGMMLPGVDTIIFLSDGAPVAGKFDVWSRVVAGFHIYNRYRPIAIWTLEFGAGGSNLAWMEELSAKNFGKSSSPVP